MKKRATALLTALALVTALGAGAVLARNDAAAQTSQTAEDAAPAKENASAEEAAPTEETSPIEENVPAEETAPAEENTPTGEAAPTEESTPPTGETAPAEEAAPPADEAGTLSFGNLNDRMRTGFYPLRALEESVSSIEELDYDKLYDQLRDQLNEIAEAQWTMRSMNKQLADMTSQPWLTAIYGLDDRSFERTMESSYTLVRRQFDDIKDGKMQEDNADILRQLRNAEDQMLMAGETLYIGLKSAEAADAALTRQIAQLDRTAREMQLRSELGQISASTAEQVAAGRTQAKSGQQTLRTNYENSLLQLKAMTGVPLDEALSLGALPKVTAAQLAAMDLEADLERAKEASYELHDAKKTYDDAKKEFEDYGYIPPEPTTYAQRSTLHTWNAAQYTYENTVQNFEMRFRVLYAQIRDYAQVLEAKRAALATEEKNYAVAALKYEQGNLSANALADARDSLTEKKADIASAERDLFSAYRSYYWAVEHGILN